MTIPEATQKLEAEKIKLESEMRGVGRPNQAVPNDWESVPSETGVQADFADQADVTISSEGNASLLADLEARYDTVLLALKKIEEGTYGTCEVCGAPIEEARLGADPAAATCLTHL